MKVGMYYNNKDVRIEEIPIPKIKDGEILIKVIASGICGSDVMEWYRIKKAPRVLGHEITGEIIESKNSKYKIGERVFISHHVPCNECRYCLAGYHTVCDTLRSTNFDPGGFSEYVRVPKINIDKDGVFILPDEISYEEGTFIEPLGCVIRSQRLIKIRNTVVVIGCGISGLLHIQLAKLMGAKKIIAIDIVEYKLNFAKKLGADYVINANEDVLSFIRNVNDGTLADCVIISTGAIKGIELGLNCVDRGGYILLFAPPAPDDKFYLFNVWNKLATLTTSYAAVKQDIIEAIELIKNKKIEIPNMITHILPLNEIQYGFNLVEEAKDCIKVIIKPHI